MDTQAAQGDEGSPVRSGADGGHAGEVAVRPWFRLPGSPSLQ